MPQLLQPGSQRTIVNGITDSNHQSTQQLRINGDFENRLERQSLRQLPLDIFDRRGRQFSSAYDLYTLLSRTDLKLTLGLIQNIRKQFQPFMLGQNTQKIRECRTG